MLAQTQNTEKSAFDGYKPYGREIQMAILLGTLAGSGVGGYRWARDRADARRHRSVLPPKPKNPKPDYRFKIPDSFERHLDDFESPRSKKSGVEKTANIDNVDALLPLLGIGAGGLYGAVSSKPGQKLKGILRGALGGGAVGLGATALRSDTVADYLGRATAAPSTAFGGYPDDAPNLPPRTINPLTAMSNSAGSVLGTPSAGYWHSTLRLPSAILAGVGSYALANHLMEKARINDLRSRREDVVDSAREEYFNALLGNSEDEDKNKKTAALNALYDQYVGQEKTAEDSTLPSWLTWRPSWNDTKTVSGATMGLSALAGGLLAGPYMYSRAKQHAARRELERAQDARKRYRSRHTPWIDPEELAAIAKIAR
jgi:hypothetical protein